MKVDALALLGSQIARNASTVSFPDDGDFAAKLTLGQIIKGRVLRSYEGQRYLVDFGGRQRVVDSALPLRPDEVFHGRVVGLGEQVQLQKLAAPGDEAVAATRPAEAGHRDARSLAALFEQYRAQVPAPQIEAAASVAARLADPPLAALGALVLAKLGLPLDAALIRAVHARMTGGAEPVPGQRALRLEIAAPTSGTQTTSAVPALASAMATSVAEQAAPQAGGGDTGGDARRRARAAGERVFNVHAGGAVAHRLGTLPLIVDGRLLELEVALFDEPVGDGEAAPPAAPRHRQIVIALDTGNLGRVEVRAMLAGNRMSVSLAASSSDHTLALSLHGARLGAELEALGFEVDGLSYLTHGSSMPSAPMQAVVEHVIQPGSVSRWV